MYKTLFFILFGLLVFVACQSSDSASANVETDTVIDDYARQVAVPIHPKRIVSTSPAVTEILFALGAGNLLQGRTDFCTYPPEAADIPSIGGISNLNVEHVLSLSPDLIISGSMVPQKSVEQLEKMGVPLVCVIEKPTFEGLYENISMIGHLIGHEKEADSLNRQLKSQVAQLSIPSENDRPSAYYVVGFGASGNYTAGGNTFVNDILHMAGCNNIAADMQGWSYSLEKLIQQDPDYIVIRAEDAESFCKMPPYNRLKAVRQGQVIAIESGWIDLQVPRNINALNLINQKVHNKKAGE